MRTFAILGVKPRTFVVFIACGCTICNAVDVVIFSIMREMTVLPHLNPSPSALPRLRRISFDRVTGCGCVTAATATATATVVMVRRPSCSARSTFLHITLVASGWPCADRTRAPMRTFAIFRVETGALWVLVANIRAIVDTADMMILTIVSKVPIIPYLNPTA